MGKTRMPTSTVEKVRARANEKCERCGSSESLRWSLHHRIPRGMGGSKDPRLNLPSNIIFLCGSGTEGCHGWIESHREEAMTDGMLLHRNDDAAELPVKFWYATVFIDDEGGVQTC